MNGMIQLELLGGVKSEKEYDRLFQRLDSLYHIEADRSLRSRSSKLAFESKQKRGHRPLRRHFYRLLGAKGEYPSRSCGLPLRSHRRPLGFESRKPCLVGKHKVATRHGLNLESSFHFLETRKLSYSLYSNNSFFLYSTNRHFNETYLISIGNHRSAAW